MNSCPFPILVSMHSLTFSNSFLSRWKTTLCWGLDPGRQPWPRIYEFHCVPKASPPYALVTAITAMDTDGVTYPEALSYDFQLSKKKTVDLVLDVQHHSVLWHSLQVVKEKSQTHSCFCVLCMETTWDHSLSSVTIWKWYRLCWKTNSKKWMEGVMMITIRCPI